MDRLSEEKRSWLMSQVKPKNTLPEMRVRKAAHALGYRFRLHRRDLPGKPDLVFPRLKLAIFVHGCFWHRHPGCRKASTPKSNVHYWEEKFERNTDRDAENIHSMRRMGWKVKVIWECETKDPLVLRQIISDAISNCPPTASPAPTAISRPAPGPAPPRDRDAASRRGSSR